MTSDIINSVTLAILGFLTILNILHWNGFVIPYMTKNIRANETKRFREIIEIANCHNIKTTKDLIRDVYRGERDFLKVFEQDRISLLLTQLRLDPAQFEQVRSEILRLRSLGSSTLQERIDKIKQISTTNNLVVIDQSSFSKRKYPHVRYYLNFLDVVVDADLSHDISSIMKDHIYSIIPENEFIEEKYKIVIPYNGNLVLGKEVAARIGCQFIKMRKDSFITDDRFWENEFLATDKVIILNDVLVTSNQILESIQKFPHNNIVKGFFCAVSRTDISGSRPKCGKTILEDKDIRVYPIVELSDADIESEIMLKQV